MSHSIENRYLGDLRTESTHLKSSRTIITDAPTDNNGKGNAFSPTDLVASALCSCMTTVMGICAEKNNFEPFNNLVEILKNPYIQKDDTLDYQIPSNSDKKYQTFCGT